MKKILKSTYLQPRSALSQQVFSNANRVLFFPPEISLVPYIEMAREQKSFQIFELFALDPLGSCLQWMKNLKDHSFSPESFLDFLRNTDSPFLFIVQTAGELDWWFSSFLWQLFRQELTPHRVWIQGNATALKSVENFQWSTLEASPEDRIQEAQFVQECFHSHTKSRVSRERPLSEQEMILTLASIEGMTFSAQMLLRLLKEFSIEFTDQDQLEDYLDDTLSVFVEHCGFWQNSFSLYRFRSPALYSFFRKRDPKAFPQLEMRYHGLFELYVPLKYTAETVFPALAPSALETERILRYQRFGPFLESPPCPLEWLPDSWKRLYYQALGQMYRENGKWGKSAKYFALAQYVDPFFEKERNTRALREEQKWSELEKTLQETLQNAAPDENKIRGNVLVELGSLALLQKHPTQTLHFFYQAQEYFQRGFHFQELVRLWQRIFDVEFAQESFDKAIFALNQAKKYIVPETPEWFLIYHRLGYFYQMFGEWDLALEYLRKAEKNEEKWGPPGEVLEFYTRIAHLLLNQMEWTESRYYYKKALLMAEHPDHLVRKALILMSLADLCIRLNELEPAEKYYHQSLNCWSLLAPSEQKEFEEVLLKPLEAIGALFRQPK